MLLVLLLTAVGGPAFARPAAKPGGIPPLQILQPGLVGGFQTVLPINVVLVGYRPGPGAQEVDLQRLRAGLPAYSDSVVRAALGLVTRRIGITFETDYRIGIAGDEFDDAFFAELNAIGEDVPITHAMNGYNLDPAASREISDPIAVDAVAVERWLGDHAGSMLGIPAAEPTVFLINWSGRDDFRYHYYRAVGDPEPDDQQDNGADQARALIAYGGTAADDPQTGDGQLRRVWFHDLSAGPDEITSSWDLSTHDIDGDGSADYRLPPIWEYGRVAARAFDDLSGDLAKVVRYVATDILLAPGSLYYPAISAPALPRSVSVDVTQFVPPGQSPSSFLLDRGVEPLRRLQPAVDFRLTRRADTFGGTLERTHACWLTAFLYDPVRIVAGDSCYGARVAGYAYYDMFLWSWDHWGSLTTTDRDHSVPLLLFDFPDELDVGPFAGFADSRTFYDYGQAEILLFTQPAIRAKGIGPTRVLTHEVGHHLGVAHPHDGIDAAGGIYYGPQGDFFFVWVGDEVSSVMSYTDANGDFSQFERDAMDRWLTVLNLNYANQVLASIAASPRADRVAARLVAADQAAYAAVVRYVLDADYVGAAAAAQVAYDRVVSAARAIRVPVEPESGPADDRSRSLRAFFGDPIPPDYVDPRIRVPGGSQALPAETVGSPTRNWAADVG